MLGAEPTRAFKPAADAYLGSCRMLGIEASEALMVAAHNDDLLAARSYGLRTAFVPRPGERDVEPAGGVDLAVADFLELATELGC